MTALPNTTIYSNVYAASITLRRNSNENSFVRKNIIKMSLANIFISSMKQFFSSFKSQNLDQLCCIVQFTYLPSNPKSNEIESIIEYASNFFSVTVFYASKKYTSFSKKAYIKSDLEEKSLNQACSILKNHFNKTEQIYIKNNLELTSGHLNYFKSFSQLTHFELSGCINLEITTLNLFLGCKKLEYIKFSKCNITDKMVSIFNNLSYLNTLIFHNCQEITGKEIQRLPRDLKYLDLSDCSSLTKLSFLKNHRRLTHLSLTQCKKIYQSDFINLASLNNLAFINLTGCITFDDRNIQYLLQKPSLIEVNLTSCQRITDASAENLSQIAFLENLSVKQCSLITNKFLTYFKNSYSLRQIDVAFTKIDKIPRELSFEVIGISPIKRNSESSGNHENVHSPGKSSRKRPKLEKN